MMKKKKHHAVPAPPLPLKRWHLELFVAANGYPPPSLTDWPTLRAVAGTGVYVALLALLGLDHRKLTYRYAGRDYTLPDVHGEIIKPLLG